MASVPAKYTKHNGTLTLSSAGAKAVQWKPSEPAKAQGAAEVTIPLPQITNLQQTPATAAKASMRVSVNDLHHTFTFTSAAARDDQQATTGTLRTWIEAVKASQPPTRPAPTVPPTENGGAQSAAMVMAQTIAGAQGSDDAYDDAKLLADIKLQKSLLAQNPALRQRYEQAVKDKPQGISLGSLSEQFWSTRVHLLRSHAAEKKQGQGTYNVLSVVKPQHIQGSVKLNITKEQIQLIFSQHPVVRKVYNDLVPTKYKEEDFWSNFFFSNLVKKLRGEKITDANKPDKFIDKPQYLDDDGRSNRQQEYNVPRFIDVEGNEQNHSKRLGNRPDFTMQPEFQDKAPILRTLNRMSEKMMADVPPSDAADRHGPAGMDEEQYKELQLRDLQRAGDDNRVTLNIRDQGQLFGAQQGVHTSSSALDYAKRTPAQVLSTVQHDLRNLSAGKDGKGLNLEFAIGVWDDDSSSDEDSPSKTKKKAKIGSRSTRTAATSHILASIRKHQAHDDARTLSDPAASLQQALKLGLSQPVYDTLTMTHNTTVEFLHYFWNAFFSGDQERANEVGKLMDTLSKSLDRLKAVADTAERERDALIERQQQQNDALAARTGKRKRFDPNSVPGGAKAVEQITRPLRLALRVAKEKFEWGLHDQAVAAGL